MPILKFYTSPGQLTSAEKASLAKALTDRYATLMPAFFVNVMFHELPADSFFLAGVPTEGRFVRFTAEHIALHFGEDSAGARRYLEFVGELFRERFEARGWTWEFSVTQSRRELWRIQSLVPPPFGSEAMRAWKEGGRAVAWQEKEEGGKL